jgi:hypothetical protein
MTLRQIWGRIIGRSEQEPPELRRLFYGSIVFILVGIAMAVGFALINGLWTFPGRPCGVGWLGCQRQLSELDAHGEKVKGQIEVANKRKVFFEGSLSDSTPVKNPYYSVARIRILEEEEQLKKLNAQARWYQVQSLKDSLWLLGGIFFIPVLVSFVMGRLMLLHGTRCIGGGPDRWKAGYLIFAGLGAGSIIVQEIRTSVLAHGDKIWFGWMSFCISPGAWLSMWLTYIGLGMAVAYPLCIIWSYSRAKRKPKSLDAQDPDGSWGVGKYVLFLQTWALVTFIFAITVTVIYMGVSATAGRVSVGSSLPAALLVACAVAVGWRLVWSGIGIRLEYLRQLKLAGRTWSELQAQKLAPDPTTGFLGDSWWKLPTTVLGALTAIWAVAQLGMR